MALSSFHLAAEIYDNNSNTLLTEKDQHLI